MYTIWTPLLHSQYNVHNLKTTTALSVQCTQSEHHYCTLNTMYTISKPQLHSQYNVHNLNTTTALSIQCTQSQNHNCTLSTMYTTWTPLLHSQYNVQNFTPSSKACPLYSGLYSSKTMFLHMPLSLVPSSVSPQLLSITPSSTRPYFFKHIKQQLTNNSSHCLPSN